MIKAIRVIFFLLALALLVGCSLRPVKRAFAQPSQACVRKYMCDKLSFCGPNAAQVAVGSNFYCYTSDWTLGSRAHIVCPDPGWPDCRGK